MVRQQRLLALVAGAILVFCLGGVWLSSRTRSASLTPPPQPAAAQPAATKNNTPSSNDFTEVIGDADNPGMSYSIDSVQQPSPNWFILHVTATNTFGTFHQVAVVQRDNDGTLSDVAGPDTSFPIDFLQSTGMPEAVMNSLPSYQP